MNDCPCELDCGPQIVHISWLGSRPCSSSSNSQHPFINLEASPPPAEIAIALLYFFCFSRFKCAGVNISWEAPCYVSSPNNLPFTRYTPVITAPDIALHPGALPRLHRHRQFNQQSSDQVWNPAPIGGGLVPRTFLSIRSDLGRCPGHTLLGLRRTMC